MVLYLISKAYFITEELKKLGELWSECMGAWGSCVVELNCAVIKEKAKKLFSQCSDCRYLQYTFIKLF